jgi:hypothetical protein
LKELMSPLFDLLRIGLDAKETNEDVDNEYDGHHLLLGLLYLATPVSLYISSNYIETEVVFYLSTWKPHLMHTNITPFISFFVMTTWNVSEISVRCAVHFSTPSARNGNL